MSMRKWHDMNRLSGTYRVVLLVSRVLSGAAPARVSAGRPATAAARRRLVDAARAAIAAEPWIGLIELAGRLAVSPHHLSRLFRAGTGETVSRYRNRIRVRLALERLAEGDRWLARLAAELGFSCPSPRPRPSSSSRPSRQPPQRGREQLTPSLRGRRSPYSSHAPALVGIGSHLQHLIRRQVGGPGAVRPAAIVTTGLPSRRHPRPVREQRDDSTGQTGAPPRPGRSPSRRPAPEWRHPPVAATRLLGPLRP
jgi:AraC-like DNA-binding protein